MWEIKWKINKLLLEILKYSAEKETAVDSAVRNIKRGATVSAVTAAVPARPRRRPLSVQPPAESSQWEVPGIGRS